MPGTKTPDAPPLSVARSLQARVRRYVRDRDLLRTGERVLIAVSGGADSTCLLLTLASLRRSLGITLHAAYFDHRLRGRRAAAEEQRFVSCLAERLGVPLHAGAGDVRSHARTQRQSIEDAARELRYRFLAQAAKEAGCSAVAAGHTRDDQAETVLMHILRGSGLAGLAGMSASAPWPVRVDGAPRLVRPLLDLSRADTERCCREAGVTPIEDTSNRSEQHTRNRVRHELLPALRRFNPRVEEALLRLAGAAAGDSALLEEIAGEAAGVRHTEGEVRLGRRRLLELAEAMQRHAVRLAVEALAGDRRGLSERHVQAVLRAALHTGSRLDLPRGVRVEVTRNDVVLQRGAPGRGQAPAGEIELPVPGTAAFGRWRLTARALGRRPRDLGDGASTAVLDADAAGVRLWVRGWRPGDRFQPLGLARAKKLQDFFVDAGVPRAERHEVPLVCSERGIAWVAGQRPAEWAKVTASTRRFVRVAAQALP